MVNRKTASALTIAALLACAVPARSFASLVAPVVIAQSTPSFSVPDSSDENVRVSSSSDNMNAISEALAEGYEGRYDGEVNVETKSADDAIADVLNDNADVAAISRPLTAEEEAQGLVQVPVRREKIAMIVATDSSFDGSITSEQFAQIFRGQITDWSEVGGEAGAIRLIDRPDVSETRLALRPYPVFQTTAFETGSTATQVSEDSTDAIAEELGADGISYALVSELDGRSDVRAIQLHQTLPDDPRYPFSQPYSFVYAGDASPAAAAFLGYATGGEGQAALQSADISGYGVAPAAENAGGTSADTATADATESGEGNAAATGDVATNGIGQLNSDGQLVDADGNLISPEGFLIDADGNFIDASGNLLPEGEAGVPGVGIDLEGVGNGIGNGVGNAVTGAGEAVGDAANGAREGVGNLAGRGRWWWLLLPLAGLGLLIWAAGRRGSEEEAGYSATASGTTDDRVRNSFMGKMPDVNTPNAKMPNVNAPNADVNLGSVNADGIRTSVGNVGTKVGGMGKAGMAGAAGLAGGAAAGAAGLAGRMKGKATDAASGIGSNVSGSMQSGINGVKGGVDGMKGAATGGLGNLRSNVQGGVDNAKGSMQGGVDGIRGNVQNRMDGMKGNVQGRMNDMGENAQGHIDGMKDNVQSRVDGIKGSAASSVDNAKTNVQNEQGSWLDRAKQRINEASENVKDTASDVKDDLTK